MAGVEFGESAKAYPVELVRREKKIVDSLAGEKIILVYDEGTDRISATIGRGKEFTPIVAYWFVWKGIHPETGLYKP